MIMEYSQFSGKSYRRVAEDYGISKPSVHNWVKTSERKVCSSEDYECRNNKGYSYPREVRIAVLHDYYEHCLSITELSGKYNIGRYTIHDWVITFERVDVEFLRCLYKGDE